MAVALEGRTYSYILDKPYRWERWAAPKGKDGKLDHNAAQTGDDLRDFVVQKLFPYLAGFKVRASGPNTIDYKIGEIFSELKNKINDGYILRDIINHIDELRFRSQTEKHELSSPSSPNSARSIARPRRPCWASPPSTTTAANGAGTAISRADGANCDACCSHPSSGPRHGTIQS